MKGFGVLLLLFSAVASSPFGGWEDGDPKAKVVQGIARGYVQDLDSKSNSLYHLKFLELKSVKYQIVAGTRYNLTFYMGVSDCVKYKLDEDLSGCNVSKSSVDLMSAFKDFKMKYNKQYSEKEEKMRYQIFQDNMQFVQQLNSNELGTAKYGATEFADLSKAEFAKTHLTPKWKVEFDPDAQIADIPDVPSPPDAFDWRDHNAVTQVKNQGSCGSCWAFSTTGNVEGQWAIKKGKLVSLSEQELVDCDKLDDGCNGGLPINAYKEIERLGGLETEGDYPYKGDDEKCEFVRKEAKVDISGFLNISSNEDDMKAWLYKNGPISIGINAMAMQFYFGGVSHPWKIFCNPDNLDHGVLIVGYGIDKGMFSEEPYWIIKNSWGSSWGESGYYRVFRGAGVCGLNKMPTSALVN